MNFAAIHAFRAVEHFTGQQITLLLLACNPANDNRLTWQQSKDARAIQRFIDLETWRL